MTQIELIKQGNLPAFTGETITQSQFDEITRALHTQKHPQEVIQDYIKNVLLIRVVPV